MEFLQRPLWSQGLSPLAASKIWGKKIEANDDFDVVIMGAGRLGQSLTSTFPDCEQPGSLHVVGVFDSDPSKVGLNLNGVVVESPEFLRKRVEQKGVCRGIIAVPPPAAQQAADQLVAAGICLILNYAPVNLSVPVAVICERIDPVIQLRRLSSVNRPSMLADVLSECRRPDFFSRIEPLCASENVPSSPLGVVCRSGISNLGTLFKVFRGLYFVSPMCDDGTKSSRFQVKTGYMTRTSSKNVRYSNAREECSVDSFFQFIQSEKRSDNDSDKPSAFSHNRSKDSKSIDIKACAKDDGNLGLHSSPPMEEYETAIPGGAQRRKCRRFATQLPRPDLDQKSLHKATYYSHKNRNMVSSCRESSIVSAMNPPSSRIGFCQNDFRSLFSRCRAKDRPNTKTIVYGLNEAELMLSKSISYSEKSGFMFPGVLLFGPPGCGKTALMNNFIYRHFDDFVFAMVLSADLLSPLRVQSLFRDAALFKEPGKPVVICIESINVLCKYDSLKQTLLKELDSLSKHVLVLASSNIPWEIDMSVLRHFEMRIETKLPDQDARRDILKLAIASRELSLPCEEDISSLASAADGYSASELVLIVKDALVSGRVSPNEDEYVEINETQKLSLACMRAMKRIKPSISKDIARLYSSFAARFGYQSAHSNPTQSRYLYLYC